MMKTNYGCENTELIYECNSFYNVLWREGTIDENGIKFCYESFDHKPSLEEIKKVIFEWIDSQTRLTLIEGFTWKDMPVKLSIENQINYKMAYNRVTSSDYLPTLKFGSIIEPIYYTFKDKEEFMDFFFKMIGYIDDTLSKGWKAKDSFDFSVYENILGT